MEVIFVVLPFFVLIAASLVEADLYMQNPRGSNNRLHEKSANRRQGNRVFDSQNNNRGGYNIGDKEATAAETDYTKQYHMRYVMSPDDENKGQSVISFEWTNQHGCGNNADNDTNKLNCNLVIQMMCEPLNMTHEHRMRDGVSTNRQDYQAPGKDESYAQYLKRKKDKVKADRAYHEPFEWYDKCKKRKRNHGLLVLDQNPKDRAINTRQNPNGNRNGYECPEERDYWPYWHPSPWKDLIVLSERMEDRCEFYKKESFNVKPRHECVEHWKDAADHSKLKHYSEHNNKKDCEAHKGNWTLFHNYLEILPFDYATCKGKNETSDLKYLGNLIWGIPMLHKVNKCLVALKPPECYVGNWSRVNHLGNGKNLEMNSVKWKIPAFPSGRNQSCVLRMRYNISTDDYNPEEPFKNAPVQKTLKAPNGPFKVMGQFKPTYPKSHGPGKTYLATADDGTFLASEIVIYENHKGNGGPFQWFGYQSNLFRNKYLTYSFDIKYTDIWNVTVTSAVTKSQTTTVIPEAVPNHGMKIYGRVYNGWLKDCVANVWCHVEETVKVPNNMGDGGHVILIWDGVQKKKFKAHVAKFTLKVVQSPVTNNPTLNLGIPGQGTRLAINTAQFGRTFQDRTHNTIFEKLDIFTNGETLHTIGVRGKRGNIVQTFPAVEYDFFPTDLNMTENDMVLFRWTGSNTHNNGNPGGDGQTGDAGQGKGGTDRSNICSIPQRDQNFCLPFDHPQNMCQNITKIVWSHPVKYDVIDPTTGTSTVPMEKQKQDACIQLMSSGYYRCVTQHSTSCEKDVLVGTHKVVMNELLNDAPATFTGIILKFRAGTYHIMSTRNNAFTNRSQKGTIKVARSSLAWTKK